MAVRARLTPPREVQTNWPWHHVKSVSLNASLIFGGSRRMEAENFLASGYGTRIAIEAKAGGWSRFSIFARVWQPLRLKGAIVAPEYGKPYLSATQVFDVRPVSRRFLSVERINDPDALGVSRGQILITRSGSVGRSTLAHSVHEHHIISDDLLRIKARDQDNWGWIYAYLRAPMVREMMKAAQYGHVVKHLETHHLDDLPIIHVEPPVRAEFDQRAREILAKRDRAYAMTLEAEALFSEAFAEFEADDLGESGFSARASEVFGTPRRRLDAWHYNPGRKAIVAHLAKNATSWTTIEQLGFKVWLPTRFRRIAAADGVSLLDSSDLFEINPDISKRIADMDFGDLYEGRVKQGWILLSRSGQIYGLNGSAMISGHCHEEKVISDHIIRIAPDKPGCRVGYLIMAMTHPKLGRPRIKALPYGSSIPEIEVYDVQQFAIPRLYEAIECEIADRVEAAAQLRDEADKIEIELGEKANDLVIDFLAQRST